MLSLLSVLLRQPRPGAALHNSGAGEGNRTLVVSLEGFCSTIELHPRKPVRISPPKAPVKFHRPLSPLRLLRNGGGGWIRTNVGVRQRVYSPSPLATRAPLPRIGQPIRSRQAKRERAKYGNLAPFVNDQKMTKTPYPRMENHLPAGGLPLPIFRGDYREWNSAGQELTS
jgi:hypothetical protein